MNFVVDAHQHFWTYGTYQTSWMEAPLYAGDPAFQPLRRSFQPADLTPELTASGVRYTVTIEAGDAQIPASSGLFAMNREMCLRKTAWWAHKDSNLDPLITS